ncbi:serine/threonine kinase [Acanthamoeba castellanii str. Neff]|uniref:Serine/threonine kinase n=1 Tax=Acanthamoeba castellanii (strain ATCC 30010 / Neff) TaxID=1257118 RepID=L8GLT9_ACACF|nr:serine/threonine kinase [Acanthamoeba castellanii str. Neff]ELR13804.1 serine/threonine kinase [Acanthamoeba castellanii str. Neff]
MVPSLYINAQDLVYEKEIAEMQDLMCCCWAQDIINALNIVAGVCTPEKRINDLGDNSGSMTRGLLSRSNALSINVWLTAHGYGMAQLPLHDSDVYVVISNISGANWLWELNHSVACKATMIHNVLMHNLMTTHNGYEVHMSGLKVSMGTGTFCIAFHQVIDAVAWCSSAQHALVVTDWPARLLCINGAHTKYGNLSNEHFVYCGLHVHMGVHVGLVCCIMDPKMCCVEYVGLAVKGAMAIVHMLSGGQVLVLPDVKAELADLPDEIGRMHPLWIQHMGNIDLEQAAPEGIAYQLIVNLLEMCTKNHVWFNEDGDNDCDVLQLPAEDMSLLVLANKCWWFIDLHEIETSKMIGCGTSAVVYRGLWSKLMLVAVKIFNWLKMTEEQALQFQVEVATLTELSHPNILLFISATISDKHLLLITEFVPCGSLAGVLANTSEYPLMFTQCMHMAYGAAHGVCYLHLLDLLLLHHDLKLLNLLVDDCLTVKVADFGFVCIKENNATMTNCGMPVWSAPEVIQGLDYSTQANVYLFGVILWEILMCKVPYANEPFMCMVMSIIEGKRPHITLDCPEALH